MSLRTRYWLRWDTACDGAKLEGENERGRSRLHYFFFSDFFDPSDFELSAFAELSDFEESSDLALESLLEESPFDEDAAEPVEDFLA